MKRATLSALGALALASAGAGTAKPVNGDIRIGLRPWVEAQQAHVTLCEMADLWTTDLATIRGLCGLSIAPAPRSGTESVIDRAVVARAIAQGLGIEADRIVWDGAGQSRIHPLAVRLPAAPVEAVARRALHEWLVPRARRFWIEPVVATDDFDVPPGSLELRPRPFAAGMRLARRMVVWVDVLVEKRFLRALPVSFEVETFSGPGLTTATLATGAGLQPLDTSGETLPSKTRPAPAVSRGQRIALVLRSGSVLLEIPGEALQEGVQGQVIRVRSTAGAAMLSARVAGQGRAELSP